MAGEPPGLLSVRRLAGPLLSGMLLAAATPPAASPILPFFVLTPLAVHLARLPAESGGVRAFESGALAVLVQHGWGLRWLPWTMGAVAGTAIGWTAFATVLLALASLGGVASWCVRRLSTGPRALPLALALAIGWTALEWTLAHLPFGLAFPWAPIGLGLVTWPQALGLAELVGVTGVTCWLALVNGLLATAMIGWKGEPTGFNRISARIPARLRAMALATGVVLVVGPGLVGSTTCSLTRDPSRGSCGRARTGRAPGGTVCCASRGLGFGRGGGAGCGAISRRSGGPSRDGPSPGAGLH